MLSTHTDIEGAIARHCPAAVSARPEVSAVSAPSNTEKSLTTDMVLVHKVFRRELRLLPLLIGDVDGADRPRAELLAAHCRALTTALRHHHSAETDLLWRRLNERDPMSPALEQQLRGWHQRHAELLAELDGLLPLWERVPEADLQAVLTDILTELSAEVAEHLDAVEEHLLPAVDRVFSSTEWLACGLRAASWIPLHRMAWLLGAMLEDATPAERKNLMAKVPAPARLLYRMVGQEQYIREMRTLRGPLVAA